MVVIGTFPPLYPPALGRDYPGVCATSRTWGLLLETLSSIFTFGPCIMYWSHLTPLHTTSLPDLCCHTLPLRCGHRRDNSAWFCRYLPNRLNEDWLWVLWVVFPNRPHCCRLSCSCLVLARVLAIQNIQDHNQAQGSLSLQPHSAVLNIGFVNVSYFYNSAILYFIPNSGRPTNLLSTAALDNGFKWGFGFT